MCSVENILKSCRTCLSKHEQLLPLTTFYEENVNVSDYLKKYLQLEYIEAEHPMPSNICYKCFDRLLEVRKFYIQCRESEKYLKLKLSILHTQKVTSTDIQHKIIKDKTDNDIDSFGFENEHLELENNDEDVEVKSDEEMNDKFQNLKETEYLTAKSLNMDVISDDNSGTLDENFQKLVQKYQFSDPEYINLKLGDLDTKFEGLNEKYSDAISGKPIFTNSIFLKHKNINSLKNSIFGGFEFPDSADLLKHQSRIQEENVTNNVKFSENSENKKKISKQKSKLGNAKNSSHVCAHCGKHYKTKYELNQHLKSHKKIKFICKTCGKGYRRRKSFNEHQLAHNGIQQCKCKYCGKEFGNESLRGAHMKLHTEKNIECTLCEEKFVSQSQLRIHMTYHTNNESFKSYDCNLCKQKYADPRRLRKHFLKVHMVEVVDLNEFKKNCNELQILMPKRRRRNIKS